MTLVPEWNTPEKSAITLRRLLAHDAGLQSGADYRELFGADVERYALERPLVARVGERVVYSDLGFIALGVVLARALEHVAGNGGRAHVPLRGAPATAFRPARARASGDSRDRRRRLARTRARGRAR